MSSLGRFHCSAKLADHVTGKDLCFFYLWFQRNIWYSASRELEINKNGFKTIETIWCDTVKWKRAFFEQRPIREFTTYPKGIFRKVVRLSTLWNFFQNKREKKTNIQPCWTFQYFRAVPRTEKTISLCFSECQCSVLDQNSFEKTIFISFHLLFILIKKQ